MIKKFDCIKMKNDIQAKIYAETKDMSFKELKAYLNSAPPIIKSKRLPNL